MINIQINLREVLNTIRNRYDLTRLIWEAKTPGQAIAFWLMHVTFILVTLSGSSAVLFIGLLKLG